MGPLMLLQGSWSWKPLVTLCALEWLFSCMGLLMSGYLEVLVTLWAFKRLLSCVCLLRFSYLLRSSCHTLSTKMASLLCGLQVTWGWALVTPCKCTKTIGRQSSSICSSYKHLLFFLFVATAELFRKQRRRNLSGEVARPRVYIILPFWSFCCCHRQPISAQQPRPKTFWQTLALPLAYGLEKRTPRQFL